MSRRLACAIGAAVSAVLVIGLIAAAQDKPKEGDKEKKIQEGQVPPPALTLIKKLAGTAKIEEFEQSTKQGAKVYEAEWKTPDGKMEVVVSEAGDLLATEEVVPADKVPAAVKAAAEKEAGKDAKVEYEKKTIIVYQAKITKGKAEKVMLTPTGSRWCSEEEGREEEPNEQAKIAMAKAVVSPMSPLTQAIKLYRFTTNKYPTELK
ncbi:MAG TPA: hypothetical protein VMV94_00025 [Phycisphaerae bacterium]|nr:hypothetical protein [Phycisphaerae bacterium]